MIQLGSKYGAWAAVRFGYMGGKGLICFAWFKHHMTIAIKDGRSLLSGCIYIPTDQPATILQLQQYFLPSGVATGLLDYSHATTTGHAELKH